MDDWILVTTPSTAIDATLSTMATYLNNTDQFVYNIDFSEAAVNISTSPSVKATLRLYDIMIPILGIFIITLNLIVVISSGLILKRGQQPRSTYLFLGNVALADLGTGVAVLFGQFYPSTYRDETFCAIQIGMIVSTTITSVYSVGLIAIDRFLYIVYGLQYQRWVYPNRARLLIILTWLIGLVIGYLPLMGWRGDTDNGRICWFIILAPPNLVLLTTIVGILPVFVVVVLYSIILYHALRKVMQLKKATENQTGVQSNGLRIFRGGNTSVANSTLSVLEDTNHISQASDTEEPLTVRKRVLRFFRGKPKQPQENIKQTTGKSPSKWKAIKVVMFTTGSFTFTWLPYFIAATMYVNCDPVTNEQMCNNLRIAIASPLAILGFMNSLLNPIIYAWWHNGFRESVKKIWFSMCRKKTDGDGNRATSSGTTSSSVRRDTSVRAMSSSTNQNYISDPDLTEGSDIESRPERSTVRVLVTNPNPNYSDAELTEGSDLESRPEKTTVRVLINPKPSYSDAELTEGSDVESREPNIRARSMIETENISEINDRRVLSNVN